MSYGDRQQLEDSLNKQAKPPIELAAQWFMRQTVYRVYHSGSIDRDTVSFQKSLEPSHGVLQLLMKNLYSVLILHLPKPLFSVFRVLQAHRDPARRGVLKSKMAKKSI